MKKIMWENWNEKEIELADGMGAFDDTQDVNMDVENELFQAKEDMGSMGAFLTERYGIYGGIFNRTKIPYNLYSFWVCAFRISS